MCAYFDFINGYPKFDFARKIIVNYLNYPNITWRMMF